MNKEEFKDLWINDLIESVDRNIDDSWRHGNYIYEVFKTEDDRYFGVNYQVSGDGEYNGIREDEFEISELEPYTETIVVTKYRAKK